MDHRSHEDPPDQVGKTAMSDAVGDLLMTEQELFLLTGYKRAAEQLEELRRQGFNRARRDRLGRLVLERSHYDAVTRGQSSSPRPRVRLLERST